MHINEAKRELGRINPSLKGVPKLVHLTYRTRELPEPLMSNLNDMRARNPGWTFKVFDDQDISDFIREHYGEGMRSVFDSIDSRYGAARADLFRYLCLYAVGGVYLDAKSRIDVPLDEWIRADDSCILAQWPRSSGTEMDDWGDYEEIKHVDGGEYLQWFLVYSKGHPYLHDVIVGVLDRLNSYSAWRPLFGKFGVINTTGPIVYTNEIHKVLNDWPHRFVDVIGGRLLSYSVFNTSTVHYGVLGGHYSGLKLPIVKMEGLSSAVFKFMVWQGLQRAWIEGALRRFARRVLHRAR